MAIIIVCVCVVKFYLIESNISRWPVFRLYDSCSPSPIHLSLWQRGHSKVRQCPETSGDDHHYHGAFSCVPSPTHTAFHFIPTTAQWRRCYYPIVQTQKEPTEVPWYHHSARKLGLKPGLWLRALSPLLARTPGPHAALAPPRREPVAHKTPQAEKLWLWALLVRSSNLSRAGSKANSSQGQPLPLIYQSVAAHACDLKSRSPVDA